jgi:ankyrin repeat protein
VQGKNNWTPLEIAVQSGFFQIVNIILNSTKTLINTISAERGTALHIAAKSNYLPIC